MARAMTLRRVLFWLLILLLALLIAGGWYARVAWDEWRQSNNIRHIEWQGVDVSLAGLGIERFSITQVRGEQPYSVEGEELSLGWSWHWHGPVPAVFRLRRLTVSVPAWPGSGEQEGTASDGSGALPRHLPAWLPDTIDVGELVLMLPDGIRATGDVTVSRLSVPDEREVVTNAMKIEAPLSGMPLKGWRLHEGLAVMVFAGKANEQSAALDFKEDTQLEFAGVDAPENAAQLDKVRINLAGTRLAAGYDIHQPMALESLTFEGPAVATAAAIHHPQLRSRSWRLEGQLEGSLKAFRLDGRLSSDAGAEADMVFRFPFDGIPDVDAEMTATGPKGHRALASTFTAWPEELEIGEGSLKASLGLRLPSEGTEIQGKISFNGLGGLFARTAWAGLDGGVAIALSGGQLAVSTSGLTVDTVNPGISLGNVQVAGRYRSTTERVAAGTLVLDGATAELLGGNVRIEAGTWQLSEMPLLFPLELSGIELSQLMQVYPTEGLAGTGILEGTVPLRISGESVSIDAGKIKAQAPGGTLKLPADRLRGMAQNNEAMALVVQAMENFNYSVLNSTVDYDQDGKLILGLRLEGSSPDVRDGHPIVLNINLEEDIPALLTSLQLSGRVNEAVTEKVRNLIQKRDAHGESTGSGN
ncbi:YdbH domain-containing protein [Marinobacter sp. ATCH36]|uniref:YdbH domain-containing protein n=1 Tax=Marinobacter sp. ATCH36 TaxID=2945106 RepID=UPI00202215DF|nr:YdbH domain-containing protein [Marinobacter sp. ATCH36]MCL7944171.1 YdbH domain-containing protein [Marinobacter sp. ATCH36]